MPHETFDIIMLLFSLMILGLIVLIPYMILHKIVRAIARTTRKTIRIFIDDN